MSAGTAPLVMVFQNSGDDTYYQGKTDDVRVKKLYQLGTFTIHPN